MKNRETRFCESAQKRKGILRRHMITETGRYRDSVYFSIIDLEWETVKANLQNKLKQTY
jgi:hypothetical protein